MAVTIARYNSVSEYLGDGTFDMDADSFKIILLNSSHTFTATNTQLTDVSTNELSTANGYTQQTKTLASVTWNRSTATTTFDAADVTWTASSGSIGPATDAVIYDDTATNDELLFSIDFDGAQTAGDGTNFVVAFNASGIFTVS